MLLLAFKVLATTSMAGSADCPSSFEPGALEEGLEAAEGAYAELQTERFLEAVAAIDAALPCLSGPVPPALAAQLHRVKGLQAFVQDHAAYRPAAAFGACRAILGPAGWTAELGEGNALHGLFRMSVLPSASEPIPIPAVGTLYIDGVGTTERNPYGAAFFQLQHPDGSTTSSYVWPLEAPPAYEQVFVESTPATGHPQRTSTAVLALGAGSLLLLGAGGGMQALAQIDSQAWQCNGGDWEHGDRSACDAAYVRSAAGWGLIGAGALGLLADGLVIRFGGRTPGTQDR